MSVDAHDEPPPPWRAVYFVRYPQPMDLTGKDLISLSTVPKNDVARLTGPIADATEMTQEELPGDYVTNMTGEIADEVHEWPNAMLGNEFRHLVCKFRQGKLIELVWKIRPGARFGPSPFKKPKPWWKFW